jgi:CubicO group peptidase (beta-lactamase class C family)
MDMTHWQGRLDDLAAKYEIPGASLAVLHDGETTALATGVLNLGTGVEATTDSLFQIGSITKVYTATVALRLLERSQYTVDSTVAEILPEFAVADPEVTRQVTVRHLLTHTSGIDGDLFLDTGRGDDCVERYVAACADLRQNHPLGATMSYCNAGYVILGRIVERLSGMSWDAALREHLVGLLGLTHTVTLPEEVLRFRAAMGHTPGADERPEPASVWGIPRAMGPAGLVNATATEVVTFAKLHLDGGAGVLTADTVTAMQQPQVTVPDPWSLGNEWGLGWILFDWDGRRVYGHDGNTIGQSAFLRVVPDANLAIALLTNGGHTRALFQDLYGELLQELAGLRMPGLPEPPAESPDVDPTGFTGVYERVGARLTMRMTEDGLTARVEATGMLASQQKPHDVPLVPFTVTGDATVFLGRLPGAPLWTPAVFYRLPGGELYVHLGVRATPRISD